MNIFHKIPPEHLSYLLLLKCPGGDSAGWTRSSKELLDRIIDVTRSTTLPPDELTVRNILGRASVYELFRLAKEGNVDALAALRIIPGANIVDLAPSAAAVDHFGYRSAIFGKLLRMMLNVEYLDPTIDFADFMIKRSSPICNSFRATFGTDVVKFSDLLSFLVKLYASNKDHSLVTAQIREAIQVDMVFFGFTPENPKGIQNTVLSSESLEWLAQVFSGVQQGNSGLVEQSINLFHLIVKIAKSTDSFTVYGLLRITSPAGIAYLAEGGNVFAKEAMKLFPEMSDTTKREAYYLTEKIRNFLFLMFLDQLAFSSGGSRNAASNRVDYSKRAAKKLLHLADKNGTVSVKNLSEAQEIVARLAGEANWREMVSKARVSGSAAGQVVKVANERSGRNISA